jgi:hypothetical protein
VHRLRLLRSGEFASSTLRNDIKALSNRLQAMTEDGSARFAPVGHIENVTRRLSEEFDLAAIDRMVDQTAASSMAESLPAALRQEMQVTISASRSGMSGP